MKYIPLDALVAEINKRITDAPINNIGHQRVWAYNDVKDILDTLEVKEVDLGKEIKNSIDSLSNLYCFMEELFNGTEEEGVHPIPEEVTNELFEFAKHFFELGLKTQKGE